MGFVNTARDNQCVQPTRQLNDIVEAEPIEAHIDLIEDRSRFPKVVMKGVQWNLSHLAPFAMSVEIDVGFVVDVVVLFSCHCFTCAIDPRVSVRPGELYRDAWETRVFDSERYRLSQEFLPRIIRELSTRRIFVVQDQGNFFTLEATDSRGVAVRYAVFFEVQKDHRRKKRMILRVQSAYALARLSNRQSQAMKVSFKVLLRAIYQGKKIRG